ncbi:hypothetical protein GC093_21990 [Paenibacillus sp. LMG 31456]|uniref:DUF4179 domain-containing protein n=1 Tax=Paenibacillus foliorum TaxID=2654974 RepID=A0A972K3G0_9BACL|nr:hypothetical protein [Paenibacillus foliorum]
MRREKRYLSRRKASLVSVLLTASLLTAAISAPKAALAVGPTDIVQQQAAAVYALTDSLQVEVKSLLNEKTSEGTRIAAVIRIKSQGASKTVKIPDLDLRVTTADNQEITLQASTLNAHVIRTQTVEELNYYVTVDRNDAFELTDLTWYSVDWYSYPKKESVQLSIPVPGVSWNGQNSVLQNPADSRSWGEPFVLPAVIDSPIQYTPVSVSKDFGPEGPINNVVLLAENPSDSDRTVPDFTLDGKAEPGVSNKLVFNGKRVEQGPIILEPKGRKYLHFVIPTDKDTILNSFNVLTTETFRQVDAKGQVNALSYNVGRYNIQWPAGNGISTEYAEAPVYEAETAFGFDPISNAIDPNMSISLVEFHKYLNEGEGYQTAIAKYMLTNNGDIPIPLPVFQTKLLSKQGLKYSGTRQAATASEIMPHSSYVISYSYNLPSELEDNQMVVAFSDGKTTGVTGTPLGAYKVSFQASDPTASEMSFYPFNVKLNTWTLNAQTYGSTTSPITYTYRLMMDMDIERNEKVTVDQNFAKLRLELIDPTGKQIGAKDLPFTGTNRIISGKQFIKFDNLRTDEQEYPLTIQMYEVMATPTGEAKRLVGILKQ